MFILRATHRREMARVLMQAADRHPMHQRIAGLEAENADLRARLALLETRAGLAA